MEGLMLEIARSKLLQSLKTLRSRMTLRSCQQQFGNLGDPADSKPSEFISPDTIAMTVPDWSVPRS